MKRKTNHFLLIGHVYGSFTKEFGRVGKELYSARKKLKSAAEEFGLAKLLS
ncbi:hypothetical protein [Candidatus Electronema sp. PJ]|uniref:hypothetical protein n=1 Tax=Candidatus Electronema sp. PJ TaxID=3401572 RepID=UPI003AA7FE1A